MSQDRPEYEVVSEFADLASKIVKKYPEVFYGVNVDKICCVKITNKERPEKREKKWDLVPVKMPVLLHNPYAYYIVLYSADWDAFPANLRLLLIAEILQAVPKEEDSEGKVIQPDTKGYATMFRTFNSIDYLEDSSSPNILKEDIKWITNKNTETDEVNNDDDIPTKSTKTVSQEA